jgi:predicted lipoprotein
MKSPVPHARLAVSATLVMLAALALGGCETIGTGAAPSAAKAPEPPMTHARAATECWMATEKGHSDANLDKRADTVNKCIDQKMKAAPAAPKT